MKRPKFSEEFPVSVFGAVVQSSVFSLVIADSDSKQLVESKVPELFLCPISVGTHSRPGLCKLRLTCPEVEDFLGEGRDFELISGGESPKTQNKMLSDVGVKMHAQALLWFEQFQARQKQVGIHHFHH